MNSTEFLEKSRYKKIGIKSIKTSDNQNVFDISVKDDHSFLLENNIISSNCTEFVPSISLRITKGKLKGSDLAELEYMYENGIPKHLNALGIVSRIELYKSRFTRPFRKVQLMIPYDFGLPEYAGLFDYLKDNELIIEGGRKGYYNFKEMVLEKDFTRKQFIKDGFAEMIMRFMLEKEEKGYMYDFIMKSQSELDREQAENPDSEDDEYNDYTSVMEITEEINDSVKD